MAAHLRARPLRARPPLAALLAAALAALTAAPAAAEAPPPNALAFAAGSDGFVAPPAEIVSVDVTPGEDGFVVSAMLAPRAAKALEAFTEAHVGEAASVFLCGREIMRPTVRAPISGGMVILPPRSEGEAFALADVLRGQGSCP